MVKVPGTSGSYWADAWETGLAIALYGPVS
jgi:hypothetical protein